MASVFCLKGAGLMCLPRAIGCWPVVVSSSSDGERGTGASAVWSGLVWSGMACRCVVWYGMVCGVVWCGVVWCAEGAVTKRQKAGMSTHG